MKLTASMMVTLDGVYQGPGGPDEDRRGGFDRGGWTAPYGDEEGWRFLTACSSAPTRSCSDARPGRSGSRTGRSTTAAIRSPTASTSCPSTCPRPRSRTRPGRTPTSSTATSRRRCASSRRRPGRELQVHGSGELLRWLLERDLVDELNLRIYPVVVGDGLRLFPEQGQTHNLELVESRVDEVRRDVPDVRPAGRATFGNVGE